MEKNDKNANKRLWNYNYLCEVLIIHWMALGEKVVLKRRTYYTFVCLQKKHTEIYAQERIFNVCLFVCTHKAKQKWEINKSLGAK